MGCCICLHLITSVFGFTCYLTVSLTFVLPSLLFNCLLFISDFIALYLPSTLLSSIPPALDSLLTLLKLQAFVHV